MSGKTICIVDDDPEVVDTLSAMLVAEGYEAVSCGKGLELGPLLARRKIDLVLLDRQLPDGDGLVIAGQIRAMTNVPIMLITGRGSEIDRIVGLEIGADDYIVKPFSVREVAARIRAVLRRTGEQLPKLFAELPRSGYRFAGFLLDLDRRQLYRTSGQEIALTVGEFDLLKALVETAGRIVSRVQLLDLTRHDTDEIFDRSIDVLILRLRRKIESNPQQPSLIVTERNLGYRFDADVERIG